jgi:hypothetical protein
MEKLSDDFKMAESVYEKKGSGGKEGVGWMKMKRKKKSRRHIYTRQRVYSVFVPDHRVPK